MPSTKQDEIFQRIAGHLQKEFNYDDQTAIEAARNWINFVDHLVKMSISSEEREKETPTSLNGS